MAQLVTILGMHRSGTSAFCGVARELGLGFGWLREPGDLDGERRAGPHRNAFNARGNHENRELRWLHDKILKRSGGSWFEPPESVEIKARDREKRDEVVDTFEDDPVAIKDPRMLLVMDLYSDLDPVSIGVIRNPVSVADSLDRRSKQAPPEQERSRQGGHPVGTPEAWEALWRRYNYALLSEIERKPAPVVDFDRGDLEAQARAALQFHGIETSGSTDFFDPNATKDPGGWEERVRSPESMELWERLSQHVAAAR